MSKKVLIERNGSGGVVSTVAIGDGLEFHGEWMSHGYVTVTVNSAREIAFAVGDFVEFAGRKFYLWDEESVKKQARSGSYGEAYVYDNIKLHEGTVALEQVSMHDVVLEGNGQTYSSLSRFSFFGATVDDLADRIQANLVRQSTAIGGDTLRFRLFTPDRLRTTGRMSNMGNVGTAWESYYTGNEATGKKDVAVSIQNETLWGALGHAYNDFELPYYVASSNENDVDYIDIVIGGKAVEVSNSAFVYGKGHGLYEIERSADSDQRIVTKLFAYGSTENLPTNYYGNLYKTAYVNGTRGEVEIIASHPEYVIDTEILYDLVKDAFTDLACTVKFGNLTQSARVTVPRYEETEGTFTDYLRISIGEESDEGAQAFYDAMGSGTVKVYITTNVDLLKWPNSKIETASGYPGGMAIMNLMLPGFPKQSLADWVDALPAGNATKVRATNYVISDEETDPWIQSANAAVYGIREGEVYFDGTDDRENIRPSIENTDFGTVASVTGITDDGWVDKTEGFVIKVLAANGGGDFWRAVWDAPHDDEVPLTMTSGYHNGREFKLTKVVVGTTYVELSVDRIQDESGRWVPNTEQPIVGRDLPTPQHDTFVVTGIQLPKEYIDAASEKLLMAAFDELDKIDHGLRTYQPRLDEIYMANEQATAEIESRASLHDTLRAGMVLKWQWEDYGTQGATVISSTIDVLTIKEDGNNGVPTYDVVLRDEKEKSLTEKIATVVSKTTGIGGGTAVRSDGGNADTAKKADRLSGDDEVTAWGQTYWQDGRPKDVTGSLTGVEDVTMSGNLSIGEGYGIESDGDAVLNDVSAEDVSAAKATVSKTETIDGVEVTTTTEVAPEGVTTPEVQIGASYSEGLGGTGGIFKMIDGKSYLEADRLYVRMKAYFDTLEIRRYIHSGGNRVASAAGAKLSDVAGFVWQTILGVKTARPAHDGETADFYRCLFRASDGDNEITNDFEVGDLAYCHTTNLAGSGQDTELNQKHYWRLVIGKGSIMTDGVATEHYIDLSNAGSERVTIDGQSVTVAGYMTGSDEPSAEDDVVQLGNVNDPTRRGAIVEAVSGAGCAPTYRIYQGLGADSSNLYTLTSPKVDMGYDMGNAKAYLNVFGNFYVGAEGNNPSTYVRYTQGDGQNQPLLEIKAKIDATSGSPILNTINSKAQVYTNTVGTMSSVAYKAGDLWILPEAVGNYAAGTVLIAKSDKGSSFSLTDWKAVEETDFYAYVQQIVGGSIVDTNPTNSQQAANKFNAIKAALNDGTTTINGGLVLTNLIALKNGTGGVTAGITGQQSGNDIALWLGGPMADSENPQTGQSSFAKSLFRFDGSGYLAGGNISWEDDGDTEVRGTIRAKNLFHNVCVFQEKIGDLGIYSNGRTEGTAEIGMDNVEKTIVTTGDADVVYMLPIKGSGTNSNGWGRNKSDAEDMVIQPGDSLYNYWGRTLILPSPQEYEGKVVEVFIRSDGDLSQQERDEHHQQHSDDDGWGIEKEIRVIGVAVEDGEMVYYPVVGMGLYDPVNNVIATTQEGDNTTITQSPSVGYLRFIALRVYDTANSVWTYAWIFSTGMGGISITNINGNVIYSRGIEEAEAHLLIQAYLLGEYNLDGNQVQDPLLRVPVALKSDFNNYLTIQQIQNGYVSTSGLTSALADYVTRNTQQTITAEKTFAANVWLGEGNALKSYDANTDLLAYKSGTWGGVTGAHWFVGAAGVNGFIRSYGELKRWKDANTQYRIWDESNFTPSNYLLSSAISDWAKAANKPAYNLDEVADGSTRKLSDYVTLGGSQTITGAKTFSANVRLKNNTNYGMKLLFGDDEFCYLHEDTDDHLVIHAGNGIELDGAVTVNGSNSSTFALDVAGAIRANTGIRIGASLNDALMMDASGVVFGKAVTSGGDTSYITSTLATFEWDNTEVSAQYGYLNFGHRPKVGGVNVALTSDISGYVPINGDSTITGNIKIKSQLDIVDSNNTSKIALFGNSGQIHATNVYIGGNAAGNLAATRTWVGQQGYQANVIEGVTAHGTACPITNKIAEIPLATSQEAGVVLIGDGLRIEQSGDHLEVDTNWLNSQLSDYVKAVEVRDYFIGDATITYGTMTLKLCSDQSAMTYTRDGNAYTLNGGSVNNGILVIDAAFTLSKGALVKVTLTPISESTYDWGAVGFVDDSTFYGYTGTLSANAIKNGSCPSLAKASGTAVVTAYFSASAGTHHIELGYFKDGSQSYQADNVTVRFEVVSYDLSGYATTSQLATCVTAIGTNGNFLTYTRNGVTSNVTVPYATKAGGLDVTAMGNDTSLADSVAGTFAFSVNNLLTPNDGYDYAGLQVGYSADKWQLTALSGHLYIRQNDNGGTSYTGWSAWRQVLDAGNWSTFINLSQYATSSQLLDVQENAVYSIAAGTGADAGKLVYTTGGSVSTAVELSYLPLTGGRITGNLVMANANNTTNDDSVKIAFYTNKNYTNISPYIQAINEAAYGRKRLSVFQKNVADWDTAQVEVFTIKPDGKVGIGTTSPEAKLHVDGSVKIAGVLAGVTNIDGMMVFDTTNLRVGLGTATPTAKLDVVGDVNVSGALTGLTGVEGSGDLALKPGTNGKILFYKGSYQKMEVNSNGVSVDGTVTATGNIASQATVKGNIVSGGELMVADYFRVYVDKTTNPVNMFFEKYGSWSDTGSAQYNFDGIVYATTFNPSDISRKDVTRFLEPSVMDIAHAPIIEFTWKNDSRNELQLGSIAQYWQTVLPQAVKEAPDGSLAMNYDAIALAAAVATARKTVDNERRIAELELRIAELEDLLESSAQNADAP